MKHITAMTALFLTVTIILGACTVAVTPPQTSTPIATPTQVRTPIATITRAPTGPATPLSAKTPTLATTPETPSPMLTAEEAKEVVEEYYQAIDNEDIDKLTALTEGQALDSTNELINQVRDLERQYNVKANLTVTNIQMVSTERQGNAYVVQTTSTIETSGSAGFFSVPGPTIQGPITFTVENVNGQPKITGIER